MNIFQTKRGDGTYRLMITSDKPILVTYHDLLELANGIEFEAGPDEVTSWLRDENCPRPINHNEGIDAPLAVGVWVYDRILAHFDVMMNCSTSMDAKDCEDSDWCFT